MSDQDYTLTVNEPFEHGFDVGSLLLHEVVEFRIGKEIESYDGPDKLTTTTTLTFITKSNQVFRIFAYCDGDLKIYEGSANGRVIPARRYVSVEA